MSKRMMTKFTAFSFAAILTVVTAYSIEYKAHNQQANLLKNCMAVESSLPLSHHNHPCQATYLQNKSWWAWLSNDSKSAYSHFSDLVELLHYSFH